MNGNEMTALPDGGGTTPIGGIIMFNGTITALPANWRLCDGNNNTPNLTNRFVYGTNVQANIGNTGGNATTSSTAVPAATHTHTGTGTFSGNALAAHGHNFNGNALAPHTHNIGRTLANNASGAGGTTRFIASPNDATDSTEAVGAGTPAGTITTTGAGTPAGSVGVTVNSGGTGNGAHTHTVTPPHVLLAYIMRVS